MDILSILTLIQDWEFEPQKLREEVLRERGRKWL